LAISEAIETVFSRISTMRMAAFYLVRRRPLMGASVAEGKATTAKYGERRRLPLPASVQPGL
jgi:hypothetical protein